MCVSHTIYLGLLPTYLLPLTGNRVWLGVGLSSQGGLNCLTNPRAPPVPRSYTAFYIALSLSTPRESSRDTPTEEADGNGYGVIARHRVEGSPEAATQSEQSLLTYLLQSERFLT